MRTLAGSDGGVDLRLRLPHTGAAVFRSAKENALALHTLEQVTPASAASPKDFYAADKAHAGVKLESGLGWREMQALIERCVFRSSEEGKDSSKESKAGSESPSSRERAFAIRDYYPHWAANLEAASAGVCVCTSALGGCQRALSLTDSHCCVSCCPRMNECRQGLHRAQPRGAGRGPFAGIRGRVPSRR